MNNRYLFLLFLPVLMISCTGEKKEKTAEKKAQLKRILHSGWGNYNTQNALSWVLLPEGFEIAIDFASQARNSSGYLAGTQINEGEGWNSAQLIPYANTVKGWYSNAQLKWQNVDVFIRTATEGNDLVALITPVQPIKNQSFAIIRAGMLWNKAGKLTGNSKMLVAELPRRNIRVFPADSTCPYYNVKTSTPYLPLPLSDEVGFSTGHKRTLEEIKQIIAKNQEKFNRMAETCGDGLAEGYKAISTCVAWNTIYDPVRRRVITTMCRPWNVSRGGYSLFGWDNFFGAYLSSLVSKELAFNNIIEHLNDMTEEGFIPNNSQANGRMTWDRSQPPVGSIMLKEIYKKYPDPWIVEQTFDKLLQWNRWWMKRRYYKGMLCWGSHVSKNPYNDPRYHDLKAAMLESGIDDSPMYEQASFNSDSSVMELHDVGLNALYIADCDALAEMALLIGRNPEAEELKERANRLRTAMNQLWSETDGIYYNRNTTTGEFNKRLSPTLFYPLLARSCSIEQAKQMMQKHFHNPLTFAGEWILPSIARNDTSFYHQKYWKGSIWAPLNFLVYLGLRNYPLDDEQNLLSKKSYHLFIGEWSRKGYISENYSSENGTGDDPKLKSEHFYTWGALLGIIPLIHAGHMPAPEDQAISTQKHK